jgi:hypothetical protein
MRWDLKKIKKETNDGKSTISAWMLVDGQTKKSSRTIEMQEFEELNELAAAGIYEALSDGPQSLVQHLEDASEMWTLLKKTYSVVGFSAVDELMTELDELSYGSGQSATVYVEKFQELKRGLENLKTVMPAEWYVHCLIRGLQPTFHNWVSEVRRREGTFDLDQLMVEIVAEERSLLMKEKNTPGRGLLSGSMMTSTREAKPIRCWICAEEGHKAQKCPSKKSGSKDGKDEAKATAKATETEAKTIQLDISGMPADLLEQMRLFQS